MQYPELTMWAYVSSMKSNPDFALTDGELLFRF
jgi:hypothetical protein